MRTKMNYSSESLPSVITDVRRISRSRSDARTMAWKLFQVVDWIDQIKEDNKAAISTYKIPKGHEDDDYGLGVFDITIPLLVHFDVFSAFNDYGVERWEDELLRRHLDPEPRRRSSDPA